LFLTQTRHKLGAAPDLYKETEAGEAKPNKKTQNSIKPITEELMYKEVKRTR
jgi:hypothetical protein